MFLDQNFIKLRSMFDYFKNCNDFLVDRTLANTLAKLFFNPPPESCVKAKRLHEFQ